MSFSGEAVKRVRETYDSDNNAALDSLGFPKKGTGSAEAADESKVYMGQAKFNSSQMYVL